MQRHKPPYLGAIPNDAGIRGTVTDASAHPLPEEVQSPTRRQRPWAGVGRGCAHQIDLCKESERLWRSPTIGEAVVPHPGPERIDMGQRRAVGPAHALRQLGGTAELCRTGAWLTCCGAIYEMETRLRPLTDPLGMAAKTCVDQLAYQFTSRLEHFELFISANCCPVQSHRHRPPTSVPTKMGTSVIASGL